MQSRLPRLIACRTTERTYWLFDDLCHQKEVTQSEMLREMVEKLVKTPTMMEDERA